MVSLVPLLSLFGSVGFLFASGLAVRFYRDRPLFRNYWLLWIVALVHLAFWSAAGLLGWFGVAPDVFGVLQPLLLTVGLTALLHIALYDNTGSETLLQQLQISEDRNSKLIDNFPDGAVVLFDDSLRVLLAGGDDLPGIGGPADAAEGDQLQQVLPAPVASRLEPHLRDAVEGESASLEITRGGGTYQVEMLSVGDGRLDGREGMLVVQDVTARERRERALREQRDELAALDRINRVIRDVDHALVGASTHEEVARAVADRLATDEPFRSVVVASLEPDGRLVPEAWSGEASGPVDGTFPGDAGPGARAIETGDVQVVRGVDEVDEADPWRRAAREQGAGAFAVVPIRHDDRSFGVIGVFADRGDALDERELDVVDQFGETVGHAMTAIERRERADLLAALHRATGELLHAETAEAIGGVAVDAGTDLLDVGVAVFHYDERRLLKPVAASEGVLEGDGEAAAYGGERGSITWQTYVSGEERTFDDVRAAGSPSGLSADARGAMFVPLGDQGVLAVTSSEVGLFDEQRRQLVELLAATTEAAFDRLESESDLREREAELSEQNRRLRRLERVNDIIREVAQAIVGSSSRSEIERTVCDRLTGDDRFQLASVSTLRRDDETVAPRAWAGDGVTYLDDVSFDRDSTYPEPTVRTLATGEPTVVGSLMDHAGESEWVARGLDHGISSAVCVPVRYRDMAYGALTVYARSPDEFDEGITTVLAELAETVAHAIDARETKRGLLLAGATEIRLRLRGSRSFLNEFAALADAPVRVVETRPGAADGSEVYLLSADVPDDELDALCRRLVLVDDLERVSERADGHLYRARVSDTLLSEEVVELGAIPRSIEATADQVTLQASLLSHVEVGEFVERLRQRYPEVELDMRRERDAPAITPGGFFEELESIVTDRQLDVLREAYERGYFESPRESTGSDIAEALGVSQPTVNYHIRTSLRRLLSLLFGEREGELVRGGA